MEPAPPARKPRLTWLVYAALAAALGAYAVKVVLRHNIDFRCYWDVGQYALHHLNIYMPSGVGYYVFYLPYFALLMVPWALLPYLWGGALWFALKVWMVTAMHRTHAAAVGVWALPRTPSLVLTWLPLLVLLNCWNNDFKLGQVNVLIHFFLWRCLLDAQRGHTTRAGLFFVLAMVKVTPWVFVPYFVVTRQWRLLRSIVGWSLVAALALVLWFGPSEATALPQRWLEVSQREKLGVVGSANIENQSIHGVVARALAHVELEGPRDYVFTATPEDEARFKPITYAWCLAVFLWALWMIARHGGGRQIRLEDAALMMVVMLLVSPDTRLFHMVHLYVPLQVLALGLAQPINDAASRLARAAFVTIGLTFVLTSRDLIGPVWHSILRYHGHQAITLWVITAALAWLVRRKRVPA
jgi:hypothetical protein